MFTWSHEDSIDVDLPLQKAWDLLINPSNWPKWEEKLDACVYEGELKAGSKIKAKIKNKPAEVVILFAEVRQYQEYKYIIKSLFFTQESLCMFHEISSSKTRVIFKTSVISFFTPFMKKYFLKNLEQTRSKYLNFLSEIAIEV
jgi:hypothetical protein